MAQRGDSQENGQMSGNSGNDDDRDESELLAELERSGATSGVSSDDANSLASSLTDEIAQRYSPDKLSKIVATQAGQGERLDFATRNRYEKRFGVDLSGVKIITGSFAEEFTAKQGAEAVTVGGTGMILMRRSPLFAAGAAKESLLAHELTHVAQAAPGFHKKATQTIGTSEAEQEAEEHEAQVHAEEQGADADDDGDEMSDDEMREALLAMVLKLIDEDEQIQGELGGSSGFSLLH